jgi:hypothetical protein
MQWQKWRSERPRDAPELTDLHRQFLSASEVVEAQRNNRTEQEIETRQRLLREQESAQQAKDIALRKLSKRTTFGIGIFCALIGIAGIVGYVAAEKTRELQVAVKLNDSRQNEINVAYLKSKYSYQEASYSLHHIEGVPKPPSELLQSQISSMPRDKRQQWQLLVDSYENCSLVVNITNQTLDEYGQTLALVPAQDWATKMQWNPGGSGVLSNRVIMVGPPQDGGRDFFDVEQGKLLAGTDLEKAQAAYPSD